MPRIARAVAVGVPHHVTQRGNHRQDVFFTPDDYAVYLHWLAEYATKYQLRIWACCLMPNHVHLVVTPEREDTLARTMQAVQSRFTQRLNSRLHWHGHLWQGRFFSAPLDEYYFWHALRYVERNPVRAGLVARAETYPWSSAAAHCGVAPTNLLAPLPAETLMGADGWSAWLAGAEGEAILSLRAATSSGRPCGTLAFVEQMSSALGRPLQAPQRGRPRKTPLRSDAEE